MLHSNIMETKIATAERHTVAVGIHALGRLLFY